MEDSFDRMRDNILHKECCFIRQGYGSKLRLGLGELVHYKNPQLKGKFHGEWDLISRTFAWRMSLNNKLLCGSDDEVEFIDDALKNLKLGSITDIKRKSISDVSFLFSEGILIEFFCCSLDDNQMMIMKKGDTTFEFKHDGIYEVDINEHFSTLSAIESFIADFSEECSKRWEVRIPLNSSENKCDDCFYMRGIDGHFYFWDFGICSNEDSPFDAKLVGCESGCEFHRQLKELI
jgi:hypothetical protein